MENIIAFQLPVVRSKPEPQPGIKREANEKTASPFGHFLKQAKSPQQKNAKPDEQTDEIRDMRETQATKAENTHLLALVVPQALMASTNVETAVSANPFSAVSDAETLRLGSLSAMTQDGSAAVFPLQQQTSPLVITSTGSINGKAKDQNAPMTFSTHSLQVTDTAASDRQMPAVSDNMSESTHQAGQVRASNLTSLQVAGEDAAFTNLVVKQEISPAMANHPSALHTNIKQFSGDPDSIVQEPQESFIATSEVNFLQLATTEADLAVKPANRSVLQEQSVLKQADGQNNAVLPLQGHFSGSAPQNNESGDFQSPESVISGNGLAEPHLNKLHETVFEVPQSATVLEQQDIINQIVDRARLYLRPAQQSEMILHLKPEHLGELTLRVSVESGLVNASFHSDNPEVRQVIETSLPQLKQELSQQGIKLDNLSVFTGTAQFFDHGQRSAHQQQPVPIRKNRRELLQAIESTDELTVNTTDGVDYRI